MARSAASIIAEVRPLRLAKSHRGAGPFGALADDEGVTERDAGRLMRLAFLAPRIAETILAGAEPAGPAYSLHNATRRLGLAGTETAVDAADIIVLINRLFGVAEAREISRRSDSKMPETVAGGPLGVALRGLAPSASARVWSLVDPETSG